MNKISAILTVSVLLMTIAPMVSCDYSDGSDDSYTYHIYLQCRDDSLEGSEPISMWLDAYKAEDRSFSSYVSALRYGLERSGLDYELTDDGWLNRVEEYQKHGKWSLQSDYYEFAVYYADGDTWEASWTYEESTTIALIFDRYLWQDGYNALAEDQKQLYYYNEMYDAYSRLPDTPTDGFSGTDYTPYIGLAVIALIIIIAGPPFVKNLKKGHTEGRPGESKQFRSKAMLTIAIVIIGIAAGAAASSCMQDAEQEHASGIIIDYAEYDVLWYESDVSDDPVILLEAACSEHGYELEYDSNGKVISVNGTADDGISSWGLWYVNSGSTEWTESKSYGIDVSKYAAVAWAYRTYGDVPTVAVDYTGVCIYGYPQAERLVTLSPVATETAASVGADGIIVGTDMYSNYPDSINDRKASGEIAVTGTYTDPSYETVMKQNPDMIIGDGSQYNQVQMCKSARSSTNCIVIYDGCDTDTIMDNAYILSVATGYSEEFEELKNDSDKAMDGIMEALSSSMTPDKKVMVALSADVSPYVAGTGTYIDDIINCIYITNAFSSQCGWSHISTELIAMYDPEIIIIVSDEFECSQKGWDTMMDGLFDTWKSTAAYDAGEIYLVTGDATDLMSRSSPRFARTAELLAEICHPEAFGLESMPKYIGSDYMDYISYSEKLGYL